MTPIATGAVEYPLARLGPGETDNTQRFSFRSLLKRGGRGQEAAEGIVGLDVRVTEETPAVVPPAPNHAD